MSKYINRLKSKISKKLNKSIITNDDLHDLFHYYDLLEYYDYYENEDYYKAQLKKWAEEDLDE